MRKKILWLIPLAWIALLACQLDFLAQSTPTATAAPTVTRTKAPAVVVPVPTPLPPVPVVPSPTRAPVIGKATDNLRIRALPSTTANILDRFEKGANIQVVGKNLAGDWLNVILPTNPNARGWVSADFVALTVSLDQVPVVQPGVTPPGPPYP